MTTKLSPSKSKKQSLKCVLDDHELLEEFARDFNQIYAEGESAISKEVIAATKQFSAKIIGHFAYEEERIFPGLLESMARSDVAERLAELHAEHTEIKKKAKQLTKMLSASHLSKMDIPALRKLMRDLADKLQKHSAKENELFPSLL